MNELPAENMGVKCWRVRLTAGPLVSALAPPSRVAYHSRGIAAEHLVRSCDTSGRSWVDRLIRGLPPTYRCGIFSRFTRFVVRMWEAGLRSIRKSFCSNHLENLSIGWMIRCFAR